MNCPKDARLLTARVWEGDVTVETCESCGGVWAERGEIERIQALRLNDHRRELKDFDDTVGRAYEVARQEETPPVNCPECGVEMAEEDYGFGAQVLVERCPHGHGIWLDAGELEALEVWYERTRRDVKEPIGLLGILAGYARRLGG
jgi:uncharacterized protein